ncbi:aminoglycoside phosphotransferase family protein [Solibacillus silvestris]|uniref:aminoglycoside phosphotransferase family protein n=1 Tax=Solibacillus silvestris TaxID=76853 RepID=UPI003F81F98C
MSSPLSNIEWIGKSEILGDLLNEGAALVTHSMDHGFEAEVIKISSDTESFVLKVWSKHSKPDVRFQYDLLNIFFEQGISVSKPVGWGINPNGDKVLLTSFGGMPVRKLNKRKVIEIANILSAIHRIDIEKNGNINIPKYDFIDYFFPGVREHEDIFNVLCSLAEITVMKQECIIHGDYHIGNILEANDRYTVIDWTNGQLGDPVYDFAWALILMKIYISDRNAQLFSSAYLSGNSVEREELEAFEALACLRWILLNRKGGVPIGPKTMDKVKSLIINNRYLKEVKLMDI